MMDSVGSILHLSSPSPSSLKAPQDGGPTHAMTSNIKPQIEQAQKAAPSTPLSSDEEDVHQCGRCKKVFHSLQDYVAHKSSKVCKSNARTEPTVAVLNNTSSQLSKIPSTSAPQNILEAAAKDTILNHLQTIIDDSDRQSSHPESTTTLHSFMSKTDSVIGMTSLMSSDSCSYHGTSAVAAPVKQGRGRPRKSAVPAKAQSCDNTTAGNSTESANKMVMRERIRPRPLQSQVVGEDDNMEGNDGGEVTPAGEDQDDETRPKKGKRGRPKKKASGLRCGVCSSVFPNKDNLNEHKKKHAKLYKCKVCNKYFFTEAKRDKHMEKETHNYECEICHRILVSKTSLQRHKAVHSDRSHFCSTCNRGFKTQRDMKSHELCVHSNQRDHVCDVCGKGFPKAEKLSRHKLIHAPNRPVFPCPFKNHVGCEKVFFRKDKLTRHLYSHSKIKPFKCDLCDKAFARTDNLREHIRTHTGVFRYYCTLCGKGQTGPKKFVQHMQKQHNIADPEIPNAMEDRVPETLIQQHKAIVHAESTARAVKAAENAIRKESAKKTKAFKDGASPAQTTHVITVSTSGIGGGIPPLQSAVSNAISMPQLTLSHVQPGEGESIAPSVQQQQQQTTLENTDGMVPMTMQNAMPSDQGTASAAVADSRVTVQLLSQGVQPAQTLPGTISTHHFTTLLNSDLASIGEAVVRNSNLVTALFKSFPNT